MQHIWLVVLIASMACLLFILISRKQYLRWLGYAVMNILLAAVILYVINLSSAFTHLYIPINLITVLAVGILGIPGMLLLIALQLTLV